VRPRLLRRVVLLLFVVGAALVGGCSSSGSAGSAPTVAATSATSSASSSSGNVDESTVDSALAHVITGLRTATSAGTAHSITAIASSLRSASTDLRTAGAALDPPPAGVPAATSVPVATGLLRISGLLAQASGCLTAQAHAKHPSTKRCLPPLRQAEQRDASIAHGLISLAAYGSKSPRVIESELVKALRGK
jgi:hypothetical protein